MDWKGIASKVMDFAPALAGAFLGPPGAALTAGAVALARSLGLKDEATPDEIDQVLITDNPEVRLKIIQANQAFALESRKLDLEWFRAQLGDVQSARARETDVVKATGKRDYNLYILAWTIIIGFFVLMGILLKIPVPEDQNGVIFMLFGSLSAAFGAVIQYFFGSSKSSADKNEQIGQMRKQIGNGATRG